MNTLFFGLAILFGGGLLAAILSRASLGANAIGATSAAAGSALALIPVVQVVANGTPLAWGPVDWNVPYGSLTLAISPLSAWFALPILALSALAAIFGAGYMTHYDDKKSVGTLWLFYNLLTIGMVLVVTARNGVLFLIGWEVMSLASFFLVTFEHEKPTVREAGRVYLIATHLGTACLLAMFVLVGQRAGSLDFSAIAAAGPLSPGMTTAVFLLAVVGFGTKAGFMPMHVWLPEAHPAAPSHVSAVMSGVMIKTGIYGLIAVLGFLGQPAAWQGWLLVAIGTTSGILGMLFSLAQRDLKRLLAYSSVENIGIISIGLGVGVLGLSHDSPQMAVLGFAGALLHVLNHAVFKGLLFLGAGSVIHGAHTGDMDRLGGLRRRMPLTAVTFVIGAVAVSGLPPLNGFIGEFLIYSGSLQYNSGLPASASIPALFALGGLALIGGLATACFTKAFGVVFLGEPRTEHAATARAPGLLMRAPTFILATACVVIGLAAPMIVDRMGPMLAAVTHQSAEVIAPSLGTANSAVSSVVVVSLTLLGLVLVLAVVRKLQLSGRPVSSSSTWGCGYAAPTTRMQYTSSSFSQPITAFFAAILRSDTQTATPTSLFPQQASFASDTEDVAMRSMFRPAFVATSRLLNAFQWLQHGRVNYYVMYIAVTGIALFSWFLLTGA